MRSEVELRAGPRGRPCPPSQVSSPKLEEALQGPRLGGGSRGSRAPGSGKSCAEWGTEMEISENQQLDGVVLEKTLVQSSRNPNSEGGKGNSGPSQSQGEEDT